jgi:hypothetical protein
MPRAMPAAGRAAIGMFDAVCRLVAGAARRECCRGRCRTQDGRQWLPNGRRRRRGARRSLPVLRLEGAHRGGMRKSRRRVSGVPKVWCLGSTYGRVGEGGQAGAGMS